MRMQIILILIATLLWPSLPINASPILEILKRAGIRCNSTYTGDLVLSHIFANGSSDASFPNQVPTYISDEGLMAASISNTITPLQVVFETCRTTGWTIKDITLGRVKLQDETSNIAMCLSVFNPEAIISNLDFETCSTYNGGENTAQWFRGYKTFDNGNFFLEPCGNPNDPRSIIRRDVVFNYFADDPSSNVVSAQAGQGPSFTQFQINNLGAV